MRLIDADALLYHLQEALPYHENSVTGLERAINYLRTTPTVDAVPVVRCSECKHRPTKPDDYNPIITDGFALEFPDEKCPCRCSDGYYSKYPDDDWYCPIGEHKGGVNDG